MTNDPRAAQDRLLALARIGAEHRHWDVGDDAVVYGDGHSGAPHECPHPDCALVRSASASPRERLVKAPEQSSHAGRAGGDPLTVDELQAIGSLLTDLRDAQEGDEKAENLAFIEPLLRRVLILASRLRALSDEGET